MKSSFTCLKIGWFKACHSVLFCWCSYFEKKMRRSFMVQSLQPVTPVRKVHACRSRHFLANMFITATGTHFWSCCMHEHVWKHQALFLARVTSLEFFSPKMISVPTSQKPKNQTRYYHSAVHTLYSKKGTTYTIPSYLLHPKF